uniref:Uncharacterized protein n=1 Tax=Psilocybe cubensis TaxID=181762 RepID=A0A8H7XYL3_PSICU
MLAEPDSGVGTGWRRRYGWGGGQDARDGGALSSRVRDVWEGRPFAFKFSRSHQIVYLARIRNGVEYTNIEWLYSTFREYRSITSPLRIAKQDSPSGRVRGPAVARRTSSSYRYVHNNNLVSNSPFKSLIPTPLTPSTRPPPISFPTRKYLGLIDKEPVTKSPFRIQQKQPVSQPPKPPLAPIQNEQSTLFSTPPAPSHISPPVSTPNNGPSPGRMTTPSPPPLSDEGLGSGSGSGAGLQQQRTSTQRTGTGARTSTGTGNGVQRTNAEGPRLIPVDPVRATPHLLAKIPYVPVTIAHLPQDSLEALRSAWREACAPLYHCCRSVRVLYRGSHQAVYPTPNVPPLQHAGDEIVLKEDEDDGVDGVELDTDMEMEMGMGRDEDEEQEEQEEQDEEEEEEREEVQEEEEEEEEYDPDHDHGHAAERYRYSGSLYPLYTTTTTTATTTTTTTTTTATTTTTTAADIHTPTYRSVPAPTPLFAQRPLRKRSSDELNDDGDGEGDAGYDTASRSSETLSSSWVSSAGAGAGDNGRENQGDNRGVFDLLMLLWVEELDDEHERERGRERGSEERVPCRGTYHNDNHNHNDTYSLHNHQRIRVHAPLSPSSESPRSRRRSGSVYYSSSADAEEGDRDVVFSEVGDGDVDVDVHVDGDGDDISGDEFLDVASEWLDDAKKAILKGKKNLDKWFHDGREFIKRDNLLYEYITHPEFQKYDLRVTEPKLCDPTVKQLSGYLDIAEDKHGE